MRAIRSSEYRQEAIRSSEYRQEWKAYHMVDFKNKKQRRNKQLCIQELNARAAFTRKYYRGRYDQRHKRVMRIIGSSLTSIDMLNLDLDACIALQNY